MKLAARYGEALTTRSEQGHCTVEEILGVKWAAADRIVKDIFAKFLDQFQSSLVLVREKSAQAIPSRINSRSIIVLITSLGWHEVSSESRVLQAQTPFFE